MYWLPIALLGVILFAVEMKTNKKWKRLVVALIIASLLTSITIWVDYRTQTDDQEVWSGQITNVDHKEEWEEWVPPQTSCSTDSKGNQSCSTTAGYYEHHYAENQIETSDNGWISVDHAPDGTNKFDDSYPNTSDELEKYYPVDTPTSSTHTYENKVQASYSIFKHNEIDLGKYPDLPEYPKKNHDYVKIDRIIGDVPNKQEAIKRLDEINTYLNKNIPDPDKQGKTRSWKQVNLIFVNVGEGKTIDYGYALQDKWKGGNKNDFVVSFSMDKKGNVSWVYPFSWSEVELLKLDVRDYMMDLKQINDFVPVENTISGMIADKFVRKQFADFSYLQIELSTVGEVVIWLLNGIILGWYTYLVYKEYESKKRHRNRYSNY